MYDGDGGRVRKAISSQSSALSETIYIGSLYEQTTVNGQQSTVKHIFAGGSKVCTIEPNHTYYTHGDHLGSSNVVTDETGAQVGLTEFAPYGSTFKQTGTYVFRHTCATHLIQNKANIRCVQEILSHKSLDTTQKYTQITITDLKEAHRKCHPRECEKIF